jgi:hypothetical protein
MSETERRLVVQGQHATAVERDMAAEHGITHRQARRYIRAVRKLYAARATEDAMTVDEMLGLLLSRSVACTTTDDPDWKASAKFLEQYARMRGWLDKRSTVSVQVSGAVQHLHQLDGASDAEIAALQAFHAARQARLEAGPIDTTASDDGDSTDAQEIPVPVVG